MRLEVRFDAKRAVDRLEGMSSALADPRAAFNEVGDLFLTSQAQFFRSNQWTPLRPDTVRRKLKRGRGSRPLVGGPLEKSMTVKGSRYSIRRVNKLSILMGTRHPAAHLHNQGTRGSLPRRPLIRVTPDDRRAYRGVFARHVLSARGGRVRSARRSLVP